jgi:hypothetical protein
MADQVAQLKLPKNSAELRDQFLRDLRLAAIGIGVAAPPVEPGSDWWMLGEALSKMTLVAFSNINISARAQSVLDATGQALDRIREAYALPVVNPTGSSGKIKVTVLGATAIPNGTQGRLPNGLRFQVVGTFINPADGAEIDVAAIDTGSVTNFPAGSVVTFNVAPTNVSREAKVSTGSPLTGGTDAETDDRKRDRILNTLRYKPAGGNWAQIRQVVFDQFGGALDCYIYPAPGGPSTYIVVPVKAFDPDNNDFSRAPSSAALQTIRGLIFGNAPPGIKSVVRAPTDEPLDFTLKLELPGSVLTGGNGQGWTDAAPWPTLEVADGGTVAIDAVSSDNTQITVDAETAVEPIDGQTQIAWWSTADCKHYPALVVGHSGTAGAWVLDLDRPLVGKDGVGPTVGDFISPNAQNLEAYGNTWVSLFSTLGTGEITSDVNLLPRSLRHPYSTDEDPHSITNASLARFATKHPEISDIEFGSAAQTSPTVPATVDDSPNVITPGKFAIYPL